MTTPAVNYSTSVNREFHRLITVGGTTTDSLVSNKAAEWHEEQRPQSGNAVRIGNLRKARGWNHSGLDMKYTGPNSSFVQQYPGQDPRYYVYPEAGIWWAAGSLKPSSPPGPSTNLINACEVKALERLKRQDIHLGNFIATGRQTIEMFGNTTTTIARSIVQFRKHSPKLFKEVMKWETGRLPRHLWCKIPGSWLEIQYGWRPLMSDLFGIANHLARLSKQEPPWIEAKAKKKSSDELVQLLSGEYGSSCRVTWSVEQQVMVALYYELKNPRLAELSSLGLINPAEIVWELLPWSFVVDWFLPIGSWLSALTGDLGYNFLTGSKSLKTTQVFSGSSVVNGVNLANVKSQDLGPPVYRGKRSNFTRVAYLGSPVPGLYFKNPLSLMHGLNGLALLLQAVRKGK